MSRLDQIANDAQRQNDWAEELMRWEQRHPEHKPFKEEPGSQRDTSKPDKP